MLWKVLSCTKSIIAPNNGTLLVICSVAICLAGVSKCQRCMGGGSYAHSPNVDVAKCVQILIDHGLDVNQVDSKGETVCVSFSPRYIVLQCIYFVVAII